MVRSLCRGTGVINYSYRVDAGRAYIPARCSCSYNASAIVRLEKTNI